MNEFVAGRPRVRNDLTDQELARAVKILNHLTCVTLVVLSDLMGATGLFT